MEKITSMTEEEFTKAALAKGFDKEWIDSCIDDSKKNRESKINLPLEADLALTYELCVKGGALKYSDSYPLGSETKTA